MKNLKTYIYSFLLVFVLVAPIITTSNFANAETSDSAIFYDKYRVGAVCCDGWESSATGRGACSHHGGVMYWIIYDDVKDEYTKQYTGRCD